MDYLEWKLFFILSALVGWGIYILYRSNQHPDILHYWGFRTDTFRSVVKILLPFGIGALLIFLIIGYVNNSINITWHIIPILFIYPLWGTIQQFLVISLFGGNLQDLKLNQVSKPIIITLSALLFGLVHYPYYWLMFGTFILALLYGYVFLKVRNIYAMGLFHGWLGGLFYYTVVNRDPFLEVFNKLIH